MKTLKQIDAEISQQRNEIKTKLSDLLAERQKYFNEKFDDSARVKRMICDAENAKEYQWNELGGIESWFRPTGGLSDFDDCRDEFEQYMAEYGIRVNWEYETLLNFLGYDNIVIQESYRANENGDVYQGDKLIIRSDEYRNDDGELDKALRNELIKKHMEKTGHFPSVFRNDVHGNLRLVDTRGEK